MFLEGGGSGSGDLRSRDWYNRTFRRGSHWEYRKKKGLLEGELCRPHLGAVGGNGGQDPAFECTNIFHQSNEEKAPGYAKKTFPCTKKILHRKTAQSKKNAPQISLKNTGKKCVRVTP